MEKVYDLEQRTERFAAEVIGISRTLTNDPINIELIKQVVRSAGSVGANYIEANEGLSKKDFANRIKMCRKEAKECRYWLRLIAESNPRVENELANLVRESTELMNIFGAILKKIE